MTLMMLVCLSVVVGRVHLVATQLAAANVTHAPPLAPTPDHRVRPPAKDLLFLAILVIVINDYHICGLCTKLHSKNCSFNLCYY